MNEAIVYGHSSDLKIISGRLLALSDKLNAAADVALENDDGGGLFVAFSVLEAASEHAHAWGESLPQKGVALFDQPDLLEESASTAVDRLGAFIEGAKIAIAEARLEGWRPTSEGLLMIDSLEIMNADVEEIRRAVEALYGMMTTAPVV